MGYFKLHSTSFPPCFSLLWPTITYQMLKYIYSMWVTFPFHNYQKVEFFKMYCHICISHLTIHPPFFGSLILFGISDREKRVWEACTALYASWVWGETGLIHHTGTAITKSLWAQVLEAHASLQWNVQWTTHLEELQLSLIKLVSVNCRPGLASFWWLGTKHLLLSCMLPLFPCTAGAHAPAMLYGLSVPAPCMHMGFSYCTMEQAHCSTLPVSHAVPHRVPGSPWTIWRQTPLVPSPGVRSGSGSHRKEPQDSSSSYWSNEGSSTQPGSVGGCMQPVGC